MEVEQIKQNVKLVLQNISEDCCKKLMEKLDDIGVETVDDLSIVHEGDLTGILKPIQIRKLLASWASVSAVSVGTPSSTTTATPTASRYQPETVDVVPGVSANPLVTRRPCVQEALNNYTVQWNKLPLTKPLKSALLGSARLKLPLMRSLVKIICNDIRTTVFRGDNGRPGETFLERIAKQTMLQYPKAITTLLDGQVVGTGYDDLLHKLINRFDNTNRNVSSVIRQKRANTGADIDDDDDIENQSVQHDDDDATPRNSARRKPKMQKLSNKYGCTAWQPPNPDDLTSDEAEELRLELVDMEMENGDYKQKFNQLYPLQRQDINGLVPMAELKLRWPYLFTAEGLLLHFELLTGFDIKDRLTSSLTSKIPRLLAFFKSDAVKKKRAIVDVIAEIETAMTSTGNKNPLIFGVIFALAGYFGEESGLKDLVTAREVPLSSNEVDGEIPLTPFLQAAGESVLTSKSFQLFIDHVGTTPTSNPCVALACQFAAFYIFNLCYTATVTMTMEFIQRYLVGINPDRGSKTKKAGRHYHNVNPQLLSLINQLSEFEWCMPTQA